MEPTKLSVSGGGGFIPVSPTKISPSTPFSPYSATFKSAVSSPIESTSFFHSFDLFPKVDRAIVKQSYRGGLLSIVVSLFLFGLFLAECVDYYRVKLDFNFLVDTNIDTLSTVDIHLDVTVSMPFLTINVIDAGGSQFQLSDNFVAIPIDFNTDDAREIHSEFRYVINKPKKKKKEKDIDVSKIVKTAKDKKGLKKFDPAGLLGTGDKGNKGACKMIGTVQVNKIQGNLHITALGHGYIGEHIDHKLMNFTHRIDRLQFGIDYPGLVNPLDKTMQITSKQITAFNYHINVVPTAYVDKNGKSILTSQFATTEFRKTIDSFETFDVEQSVLPGIFLKYDFEPILVRITEKKTFLIHLSAIVGGTWVTVRMVIQYLQLLSVQGVLSRRKQSLMTE